jgi:hypothetical protein
MQLKHRKEGSTNEKYDRLLYYDLLTKGVSANTVQSVVKSVLENMTNYDMNKIKLPGRTTAQRMVA